MVTLTLDFPGKNALGTASMQSILARLDEAGGRPLLITGSGGAFSAGLDLREVARLDGDEMRRFLELLERCMTALYLYPGPTVALVNGHAIAGGCVLTLACDHRVMVDDPKLRIGLNEVALGVRFPPRIMALVKARVPHRHHAEVVLGAGVHDAHAALRLGLVDEVSADAATVAGERIGALALHPADGYALAKRDLRGTEEELCAPARHAQLLDELVPTWTSREVKARVTAVLDRKK